MSLLQSNSEQSTIQGTWQKAPFDIPKEMGTSDHRSVIIDQYLIIIGGHGGFTAHVVVFDMLKQTCTKVEISGRKPGPLYYHSACYWKENQIIVYGGQGHNFNVLSEVGIITLSFDEPLKAEWRTIETNSGITRFMHTAHVHNNQMIVLGGFNGINPTTDLHILNLDNFIWTQTKAEGDFISDGLRWTASTLCGNKIYAFGKAKNTPNLISAFFSINLDTYTWNKLPLDEEDQKPPCEPVAIKEYKGKIYPVAKFKGWDNLNLKTFDISEGKWTFADIQSNDQSLSGKVGFSLDVYDNQLVLYGGMLSQMHLVI